MPQNQPSRVYRSHRGVFQGGGCRVAALAGAYEAAFDAGVRFSEVAGTSAGSILAALIGAGAGPDQVLHALRELDYGRVLSAPRSLDLQPPIKIRGVWWLAKLVSKDVAAFLIKGGVYSSTYIEEWLNHQLCQLLPGVKGRVTFADLPIPTYVVASDLLDKKPKVWSTHDTPNDSVAYAVRASCSIPVFFQPVAEGRTFYVDGGVLSNLPVFVFATNDRRAVIHDRTLAFTVTSSKSPTPPTTSLEFLYGLVDLSVEGAVNLQRLLQPDVAVISVDTGSIGATDFKDMTAPKVEDLIERGRNEAGRFFGGRMTGDLVFVNDEVWDEHQAYLAIVVQAAMIQGGIVIAHESTRWFWELFSTVLGWRRRGVNVWCITTPVRGNADQNAREEQRRALLGGMGVTVTEIPSLPFAGWIAAGQRDAESFALIHTRQEDDNMPFAKIYKGRDNAPAVRALYSLVQPFLKEGLSGSFVPGLRSSDGGLVLSLLKNNVAQYRPRSVQLSIEPVAVEEISLLSRYVRAFRLRQLNELVELFQLGGIELFGPAEVTLRSDRVSVVTPPVYEVHKGRFVAIEGNSRSFLAYQNGLASVTGVVVRNVDADLPGSPLVLKHARITMDKLPPNERIKDFKHQEFRQIERAMRPLGR